VAENPYAAEDADVKSRVLAFFASMMVFVRIMF
jgi:hypothetical protein